MQLLEQKNIRQCSLKSNYVDLMQLRELAEPEHEYHYFVLFFFRFWKKHPILPGFVLSPRNMQIIQHVSIVYRTTRYFLRLFQHKLSTTTFFPASVDLLPARIKFLHSKALKGKTASMGRFAANIYEFCHTYDHW